MHDSKIFNLRIVYADFNRTGPCIVGFRNREKNETKFEYVPEPIIGDFELLKESEVSFEDSFVFMNKIFVRICNFM